MTDTILIARRIAEFARVAKGEVTAEQIQALLEPDFARVRAAFEQLARTFTSLTKGEGDWRFSLGDGLTAIVKFTGPAIEKRHLAAFVKVFTAMAESYVEAASENPADAGVPR